MWIIGGSNIAHTPHGRMCDKTFKMETPKPQTRNKSSLLLESAILGGTRVLFGI